MSQIRQNGFSEAAPATKRRLEFRKPVGCQLICQIRQPRLSRPAFTRLPAVTFFTKPITAKLYRTEGYSVFPWLRHQHTATRTRSQADSAQMQLGRSSPGNNVFSAILFCIRSATKAFNYDNPQTTRFSRKPLGTEKKYRENPIRSRRDDSDGVGRKTDNFREGSSFGCYCVEVAGFCTGCSAVRGKSWECGRGRRLVSVDCAGGHHIHRVTTFNTEKLHPTSKTVHFGIQRVIASDEWSQPSCHYVHRETASKAASTHPTSNSIHNFKTAM